MEIDEPEHTLPMKAPRDGRECSGLKENSRCFGRTGLTGEETATLYPGKEK
jgi:hypothetical protein